jgi:hypothetical protein
MRQRITLPGGIAMRQQVPNDTSVPAHRWENLADAVDSKR